ncbi:MAG TPA: transposase [Pyrinomonadaceae bacterium]|nr:transposase [Pyrinomonadaceae bacterium]
MDEQQEREQRGLVIAAKSKLQRSDDGFRWFVPSQTKGCHDTYIVKPDPAHPHCTCPDFTARQLRCKHVYAVEIVTQREYTDDGETQTYTETVTVKKTYKQEWSAYNRAQTHEKERFLSLLDELCKGIEEPIQSFGRPRLPLADMIFASTFKVYSTFSGRRFTSDLRDAHSKGFLTRAPHYNSISRYLENPTLTPFLKQLIEISSLPLQTVESDFAVDSSGFTTCRFVQWTKAKYTDPKLMERHDWIKVHLMCGVKTNIVTSIEITDAYANDCPQFDGLVKTTARNFTMSQVSADKAYLSSDNLQTVVDNNAIPFIPFKANSVTTKNHSAIWKRMFHFYSYNQDRFMQCYHKRSNVETTFHMIKSKFGDRLRSKTKTAQVNEAMCKVLAHNLCCLIQSIYELGIEPTFWEAAA